MYDYSDSGGVASTGQTYCTTSSLHEVYAASHRGIIWKSRWPTAATAWMLLNPNTVVSSILLLLGAHYKLIKSRYEKINQITCSVLWEIKWSLASSKTLPVILQSTQYNIYIWHSQNSLDLPSTVEHRCMFFMFLSMTLM